MDSFKNTALNLLSNTWPKTYWMQSQGPKINAKNRQRDNSVYRWCSRFRNAKWQRKSPAGWALQVHGLVKLNPKSQLNKNKHFEGRKIGHRFLYILSNLMFYYFKNVKFLKQCMQNKIHTNLKSKSFIFLTLAHMAFVCFLDNICAAKTERRENNKQTFISKHLKAFRHKNEFRATRWGLLSNKTEAIF
jgi:hypothetical protein